ncbi:MAG: hypothetical protein ACK5HR_01670 [Mycoplasmatales bacterium]
MKKKLTLSVIAAFAVVSCVTLFSIKTASAYSSPVVFNLNQEVSNLNGNSYVQAGDTLQYKTTFSTEQYGGNLSFNPYPIVRSTIDDTNLVKNSITNVKVTENGKEVKASNYLTTYGTNPMSYTVTPQHVSGGIKENTEYTFSFNIKVKDEITKADSITSKSISNGVDKYPTSETSINLLQAEVTEPYTLTANIAPESGSKYAFANDTLIYTVDFSTTDKNVKPTIQNITGDGNLDFYSARDFKLTANGKTVSNSYYDTNISSAKTAVMLTPTTKALVPNTQYEFTFKIDVKNSLDKYWKDGILVYSFAEGNTEFPFSQATTPLVNPYA